MTNWMKFKYSKKRKMKIKVFIFLFDSKLVVVVAAAQEIRKLNFCPYKFSIFTQVITISA